MSITEDLDTLEDAVRLDSSPELFHDRVAALIRIRDRIRHLERGAELFRCVADINVKMPSPPGSYRRLRDEWLATDTARRGDR